MASIDTLGADRADENAAMTWAEAEGMVPAVDVRTKRREREQE
jgi:hypothetical protein